MAKVLIPSLKAEKSLNIIKRRELPISGSMLVKEEDSVTPESTIAKADLPGELIILRLPEQMGIQAFEVIPALKVKVGELVKAGQLICEFSGLFGLLKNRFFAPEDGTIEFITERTGHLGLRKPSVPITLNAFISGKIKKIISTSAVEVETNATFIQGIFGLGGERFGKLSVVANFNEQLTEKHIPDNARNLILAGGKNPNFSVITKAIKAGAVGLITGSLDDRFIQQYLGYDLGIAITGDEDVPMTVIMTEGFGDLDMSERVYKLLKESDGKITSINGATQVRAGAIRPEIIIPIDFSYKSAVIESELKVGSKIRIIRVPYFGNLAEVVEIPKAMQKIATGAEARVIKVKLDNNDIVVVPRANVELV
jgi:hypothetical protein